MKTSVASLMIGIASICIFGCTSMSESPLLPPEPISTVEPVPAPKPKRRQWNKEQLNLLRTFALQESPKLWQTVQALRAERETRTAALANLRKELVDFGRNPEADQDYVALSAANDGLLDSMNAIFEKLEAAYIAYKKFQATPGRREYGDMMRKVLDDGMNEASAAESRYLQMSRTK